MKKFKRLRKLEDLLEECKKCDCWSEELEACDEIVLCDKREKIIDLFWLNK